MRVNILKNKFGKFMLMTALAAMVAGMFPPRAAFADMAEIDRLLQELDKRPPVPATLTLEQVIAITLEGNPALQQKLAILNSVDGDVMVDKSRFFSHIDVLAGFTKQDGTVQKSYAPSFNPVNVSPLGSASIGTTSVSSISGSSGGISSADIASLTGMSTSDIAGLAAQYGVDISQFGFRPAGPATEAQRLAAATEIKRAMDRKANLTVQTPVGDVIIPDDQIQQLIASSITGGDSSSSNKYTDNYLAVRYSRRLLEWGKDPVSQVGIRSNRRTAIVNYQKEMRDVLSDVRKTFYIILLKKKQIQERYALLDAYEKKLREQQLRYEVAKDVPMIDVLTAELDVLNEKARINTLKNDHLNSKLKLLQLMGKPVGSDFEAFGEPPDLKNFEFGIDQVVSLTKDNSYQVSYLTQEISETEREFKDIRRDYRPKYSAEALFEDRRSNMGFTLNNSNNTYGVDFGAEQHLNLQSNSSSFATSLLTGSSPSNKNTNFFLSFGVTYVVDDNMKREGITKKQLENLKKMRAQLTQQELDEELQARQAWQELQKAVEQLALQEDTVQVSERRLEITRKLKEFGKVQEFQVDNYRNQFFSDQDRLFTAQENVITAQENLRKIMGVFY